MVGTRAAQAALKCQDDGFQEWLLMPLLTYNGEWRIDMPLGLLTDEARTDYVLKKFLGIASKTELDINPEKADAWDKLLASFDSQVATPPEAETLAAKSPNSEGDA
jgi:hypothetical protein